MGNVTRRGFLRAVGIAAVAVPLAPMLSLLPAPAPPTIELSVRMMALMSESCIDLFNPARMDVIYGFATVREDWACRVSG